MEMAAKLFYRHPSIVCSCFDSREFNIDDVSNVDGDEGDHWLINEIDIKLILRALLMVMVGEEE